MGDSNSSDEYENFETGSIVPKGDELSHLYGDKNSLQGQRSTKKSANSGAMNYQSGTKVLPPVPAAKTKKNSAEKNTMEKVDSSSSLSSQFGVQQNQYHIKTMKYAKTTIPSTPTVGPKPSPKPSRHMKTIEQQQRERIAEIKRQRELGNVPSRSRAISAPAPNNEDDENIYEELDVQIVPGEMSIEEFSVNFAKSLPQQIMVSKGVYGSDDSSTLSTSDLCNIHMVRRRDLVSLEEKGSRQPYSIPLNSAIKFAAVFNHHEGIEQIEMGQRFPYVSNLLDLVLMPKVVCACQSYDNDPSDPTGVEDIREIMAIKEVIHPESPAQKRKLRVYSFTDRCDKVLDERVYAHFTTRPSDIKLYMSDILKHVTSPFPMHLLMFHDVKLKTMLSLPPHLFSYPLVMTKKFTEVILIATSGQVHQSASDLELFEIPTQIDIDIQLVKLPEDQRQKLIKTTEELSEKMENLTIKTYKYENVSEEVHRAQAKLYELVRRVDSPVTDEGKESRTVSGSKGSLSQRIDKLEKQQSKYTEEQKRAKSQSESNEQFREFIKTKMKEQSLTISKQEELLKKATKQIAVLRKQIVGLKREIHGGEEDESYLSEGELVEEIYDHTGCVSDPRPEDVQGESQPPALSVTSNKTIEENKKKLASMDLQQLTWFLRSLGLGMYEDTFRREEITGELLLECTDDVLSSELGVSSKLHRLKLLKVIEGRAEIS